MSQNNVHQLFHSNLVHTYIEKAFEYEFFLLYKSLLSPPQGSIAERAIPVLFIQLAFLRGTQILFVRAPSARLLFLKGKVGP